jgi:hypothetical protein
MHYLELLGGPRCWKWIMKGKPWTEDELIELSALASAGGTAFRAAAKFKRSIISCRNQARKLGTPFAYVRIMRTNVRAKCDAAERAPRSV